MKTVLEILLVVWAVLAIVGCDRNDSHQHTSGHDDHAMEHDDHTTDEKGEHGGRILRQDDFALELAIVEAGIPPEFRVWASRNGAPLSPQNVELHITLTRLGGKVDQIQFAPQEDFLRGDREIYEPHSFLVSIHAKHDGQTYAWEYENFEGRTRINAELAKSFGLGTSLVEPQKLTEKVTLYGKIALDPARIARVSARFDGVLQKVSVSLGDKVKKGQVLARVESNESLSTYSIRSPIAGSITHRDANAGEPTDGRILFSVMDTSVVWAQLAIFPGNRGRVKVGDTVWINSVNEERTYQGKISYIDVMADQNQAVMARVELDNADGQWVPGTSVTAQVRVAEYTVPLAVKRSGLQSFRDFTVVYAQFGDQYEVRMLKLGRQDDEWVEVLSGIEAGTSYVSENSYLVKADIEKSGASHDH